MNTNGKVILGFVIALFALLAIAWAGSYASLTKGGGQQKGPANVSSTLQIAETRFDFGDISMATGKVKHSFALTNGGASAAKIEKIYTSCMCTTASLLLRGKSVGPFGMPGHGMIPRIGEEFLSGESAEVEVVFDPAAHGPAGIGRVERAVFVETDQGILEFGFAANVTP